MNMVNQQYFQANLDGTIERGNSPDELDNGEGLRTIEEAFRNYGHNFLQITQDNNLYRYATQIGQVDQEIVFRVKNVSGGGRVNTLPAEQRIQILGEQLNELVEENNSGKIGLILGIYKRNGVSVIIAWRPQNRQDGGNVSKQVNIQVIADAIFLGFSRFQYPNGNGVVCAFRMEFMHYYLKNINLFSEEVLGNNQEIFNRNFDSDYERNRIVFGAPGTGKSYKLKEDCSNLLSNTSGSYERVTFHPDYTYSQFVGTYKPVTGENGEIKYEFIPGPFMRVYVAALRSSLTDTPQPHLLLIEEINRAKVAAVFGEVFQLLDRDNNGVSEYEVHTTEDIKKYLARELEIEPSSLQNIRIPSNMFIWATMNSADQGVFPIDTAFKRRWSFEYLGIDQNDCFTQGKIKLGSDDQAEPIEWNKLRKAINTKLINDCKVNEDKLMGPFFLSRKLTRSDTDGLIAEPQKFIEAFKSKVIMYLYEDAAKQYRNKLFSGCDSSKFSSVCTAFDTDGIKVFGTDFEGLYEQQEG